MFAEDEAPKPPAWRRYGVPAAVGGVVLGGAWLIMGLLQHGGTPARPHVEPPHITSITLPPPPPPPPPPPQPKTPPKPVEQTKAASAAPKKPAAAPAKAPSAPAAVSTSIKGAGSGSLANGNDGGGDCVSDCGTGGGGDGDAYFENLVVSQVSAALRDDDRLRTAHYHGRVVIKLDKSGHVIGVSLENFDGDGDIGDIVKHDLSRLRFDDTIPAASSGQPLVVNLRAHAPG
jgi:hypothetical protein